MNNHEYFAELFDGSRTKTERFCSNIDAVSHFHDKYGTHLLAVKRVTGTSNSLIFSA